MPIDRTAYNTLVDDDGSGTTGTIWSKARIDDVLDAIDALIGDWHGAPYASGDYTAGAGTWTVQVGDMVVFNYRIHNKSMLVIYQFDTTSVAGAGGSLSVAIPDGRVALGTTIQAVATALDNGADVDAIAFVNGSTIAFQKRAGGAWANSTNATYLRGSIEFPIV